MRVRLVVARYNEDLEWLRRVPGDTVDEILVYNKSASSDSGDASLKSRQVGKYRTRMMHWSIPNQKMVPEDPSLASSSECDCIPRNMHIRTRVVQLRNLGREADTYLQHIVDYYDDDDDKDESTASLLADLTIFAQGDPFEHSPHFLELLSAEAMAQFAQPVQPLTDRWKIGRSIPPRSVLERYPDQVFELTGSQHLRVHTCAHPMSAHTLDMLRFHDPGAANIRQHYMRFNNLTEGDNLIAHLLEYHGRCKQPTNSSSNKINNNKNNDNDGVAYLCFGAMFAVTRRGIRRHRKDTYERLRAYNLAQPFGPYMLERAWMSLFGYTKS